MTDEELANNSFFNHDLAYKVTRDERSYKEGFIDGLKAQITWYKVEDKLPTHGNFVCNQDGYPCWYDVVTRKWLDIEGIQIKTIEWCELPYKESE